MSKGFWLGILGKSRLLTFLRIDVEENDEGCNCTLCWLVILKNSKIRGKWLKHRLISGVVQTSLVFALTCLRVSSCVGFRPPD